MSEIAKAYELRSLTADDIFPMFQIISKIGIKEFKACFEAPDVKNAIGMAAAGKESTDLNAVGLAVALDMATILVANLPKAKEDIYQLLAQLSGNTANRLKRTGCFFFAVNRFLRCFVNSCVCFAIINSNGSKKLE